MAQSEIAIVGAGITGLTAARMLKKRGYGPDLFEQHGYSGGSIKSVRHDQWLLEFGPNTLLLKDQKVLDFLEDIGIAEKRIQANPESSNRFIVKNGKLVPLPSSLVSAITTPLFSTKAKLRVLKEPFISKAGEGADENVAEFVRRRLGNEILEYALDPFIAGIYANKPEKLSLRHTFPAMYDLEEEYGSLMWGAFAGKGDRKEKGRIDRELISFKEGLHQLVDCITEQLDNLYLNHQIKKIWKTDDQWFLLSESGEHGPYKRVIVNIPLYKWNEDILPIEKNELDEIQKVEYPPLSVFHLGFKMDDVDHPLNGFGFLVPKKEDLNLLGSLFSSTLFPNRAPENHHLITVFVGGGRQPQLAKLKSGKLFDIVMQDLRNLIGVKAQPVFKEHVFWRNSIPAYHLGYNRVLNVFESIEERNPGLHLAGNFRGGVSVPDCIKKGIQLAEEY